MTVPALLQSLAERGVELWVEGSRLRFRALRGALTPEQREAISAQREAVVQQLRANAESELVRIPLSVNQRSLWFIHQEAPHSAAYHVGVALRVGTKIDPAALQHAVQALSDRHPTLRSRYVVTDDGQLVMETRGAMAVPLTVHQLEGATEEQLRASVDASYQRPFDLADGPVFRAELFSRSPVDHVLHLCAHHIGCDGWSISRLTEELVVSYAEETGARVPPPARAERSYADFVAWQADLLDGPAGQALASKWRTALAAPRAVVEIPPDRARPTQRSFRGATHRLVLSVEQVARLHEFARSRGTTLFVVLLAAYKAMLFRMSGTEDVIVGTPTLGRPGAEYMHTVGHFVNTVPLRTAVSGDLSFRTLMQRVTHSVRSALDGQDYPMLMMVQQAQVVRDPGRSPLFDVFFGLIAFDKAREVVDGRGAATGASVASSLAMEPYPLTQQEGQFDVALQCFESERGLELGFTYNPDLYESGTIAHMAAHYTAILEDAVVDVEKRVEELGSPVSGPSSADAEIPTLPSPAVQALLDELALRDVRLTLEGDKLKVNAPAGALDDALKVRMGAVKAELISALRSASQSKSGVRRMPRGGPLPISYAQQRLWFLDQMDPGNAQYNIAAPVRMHGPLDVEAMVAAVDAVPQRHEVLRTTIRDVNGNPSADVMTLAGSIVRRVDFSGLPVEAREREMRRLVQEHAATAFDLAKGPLFSALLVRMADEDHVLSLCMHHIASDGWSVAVIVGEILSVYHAATTGAPSPLAPLSVQYVDFAAWQREQMRSGQLVKQLAYWKKELAGAPVLLELPTDRPRPLVLTYRGRRTECRIGPELLTALKEFSREHQATLFMTLLAAWQVLLHRYSGQEDVVVGSPLANRDDPALEPLVGCFVNNVALRGRLAGNPVFRDLLADTAKSVLGAFDSREVPFDRVVEAVSPERSMSHSPVFQVMFALHSFPVDAKGPDGLRVERMDVHDQGGGSSRYDITMDADELEGGLRVSYEFATDLFDESTILRMHGQFAELLGSVMADPTQRVTDIPLLTDSDRQVLLDQVNATGFEHNRSDRIHDLVSAAAARWPDAVAVQASDATLTYAELERKSNQMAQLLRERGVRDRDLVGVCLDRISALPVALLAVLKAGAAYVPVDPAHPAERLVYTLTDATVTCVITEERFASLVSASNAPLLLVDRDADSMLAQSTTPPASTVGADDLAYVIYTSGSTGRPKGVEVEHRNVVNFLRCMEREPGFGREDVLLAVTTPSFDIAGLEMFLPLSTGACTVIASRGEVLDGEALIRLLDACKATVMQATPATWRLMIDAGWAGRPGLRVLCGGEAMPRDLARELTSRTGVIWNMYGPTETTIWSTTHRVTDAAQDIPIGHPIGNTTVYILDAAGKPAPIGVAGELCIGGEGVARGYRERPELTAEKFVTLSIEGRAPERLYRTGDVVRWRSDLTLEFVGRRDHQVKVRGYRIELGEIESVLVEDPSVRRAVVIVREDVPGDQRLVAYVVPAGGAEGLAVEGLRSLLRARLPEYMVPSVILPLADLPLTPNGKIDRKALPAPSAARAAAGPSAAVMMTEPQRRVAAIWREVLRVEHLGVDDNFFDRGGHSLLVVKVHAALKREFQRDLTLVDLFQHTTIAAQAALLSTDPTDRDTSMQRARARAARQVLA